MGEATRESGVGVVDARGAAGGVCAWEWLAAGVMAAVFAAVCVATSDFPLGVHADERRKVLLVATGQNDFFHPLLMLTLTRVVCWAAGVVSHEGILAVGRGLSSVSSALGVMACWRLARA